MNRYYLLILAIGLSSCASTYKRLQPQSTYFPSTVKTNGVEFSYKLGVLREMQNKKYAKREDKKAIRIASVKIYNGSDVPLTVGRDLIINSGNSEAALIPPAVLHRELKQGVPIYILYMLFTFVTINQYDNYGRVESSTPIGLVLGPGLTIGNMAVAGTANQQFLAELNTYNIANRTIQPGETVYGIIGVRDIGYTPLSVTIKKTESISLD